MKYFTKKSIALTNLADLCVVRKKKNGSGFEVDDKIGLKILTITNHNG